MDQVIRDVRFAFRNYLKRPGVALISIVTLAIGVGANVAVFSVVRAVLLRESPYPDSDRLVVLSKLMPGGPPQIFNLREYEAVRAGSAAYHAVAGCTAEVSGARGDGDAEQVVVSRVTPDFFSVFRVAPIVGRVLRSTDSAGERAAVISYGLWLSQFGGARDIVGRTVLLDRQPWTITGVMPAGFSPPCGSFVSSARESVRTAWVALGLGTVDRQSKQGRSPTYLSVFARLTRHASISGAQADLAVIARRFDDHQGPVHPIVTVDRLAAAEVAAVRPGLLMLQAIAAFLLLMACANLANLLLAQATARCGEVGLRFALGARRGQVIRQLLTETTVLATCGGVVGVLTAYGTAPALVHWSRLATAPGVNVVVRLPELLLGLSLSWLAAVAFGVAPAVLIARADAHSSLQGAVRLASGRTIRMLRAGLVAGEVTIAVVILTGAALFVRSFAQVFTLPMGFDPHGLVVAEMGMPRASSSTERDADFGRRFQEAVRTQLGPRSVAFADVMPFSRGGTADGTLIAPDGAQDARDSFAELRAVSSEYFAVVRVPLIAGNVFPSGPVRKEQRMAIVNQTFVRKYAHGRNLLGFRIRYAGLDFTIVGVARDTRSVRLGYSVLPAVYLPFDEWPSGRFAIAVRGVDATALSAAVRAAGRSVDPDLPLMDVVAVDAQVYRQESTRFFYVRITSLFAVLSCLLAAVGILGVVAHFSALRVHEFGIRLALGATPTQINRLVVREGLRPVLLGLVVGVVAAWWLADLLRANAVFMGQLYRTGPHDPWTLCVATLGLLLIAAIACWVPARRAAGVDPVTVLRVE